MPEKNQGANQNQTRNRGGADLAEGAAWATGGAAGAALGSTLGPLRTVAGGAIADEAVEGARQNRAEKQSGAQQGR